MKIIFIEHQENSLGHSMARYTKFLSRGMQKRGHSYEVWGPKLYLSDNNFPEGIKKWLRYIDQYVIFPMSFKIKSRGLSKNTLFVLIDQALGIWMPLIQYKNHVVHCHDFIALNSALGKIDENPISWTGKIYQRLILKGFSKANNFISVSKNTQVELEQFLDKKPAISAQAYNVPDPIFVPGSSVEARKTIGEYLKLNVDNGYILHVGGNTFYKNRVGVIKLYNAWRRKTSTPLPLLLLGTQPTINIKEHREVSPYKDDIHFLIKVEDELLVKAYQGASVFVFPSLTEGFGFPVVEAMACGSPVITTNEAPMNEVGGEAAKYVKRCPNNEEGIQQWAKEAANILEELVVLTIEERDVLVKKVLASAQRFDEGKILDKIENVYKKIISNTI